MSGFTGFAGLHGGANLDGDALNQRIKESAPFSGSGQYLSGTVSGSVASTEFSAQLQDGRQYIIIAPASFNYISSGSAEGISSASLGSADNYWPADVPRYHYSRSGSTDYVALRNFAGGSLIAFIYPAGDK